MKQYIDDAMEELKRVDHLIFVSLKYTRTVDVIKSIINRLIDAYNFVLDGMLNELVEKNFIVEVPVAPKLRCEIVKRGFPEDSKIPEHLNLYLLLRQLMRAEYNQINEFRRGVAMIASIDGKEITMDIDTITEYYKMAKDFFEHIKKTYGEEKE